MPLTIPDVLALERARIIRTLTVFACTLPLPAADIVRDVTAALRDEQIGDTDLITALRTVIDEQQQNRDADALLALEDADRLLQPITEHGIPWVVYTDDLDRMFFLAENADHATALFNQAHPDSIIGEVYPATIHDAPWTVSRCSPTDELDWWRDDEPCDYGKPAGCGHPVHAFQNPPAPVRHLTDAYGAELAAKFGWWS